MKKILKFSLWGLLAIAVIWTFYFLYTKSKPQITEYEIISPEKYTIIKKVVATGNMEPRDEISIKPQINGIITELLKEAGDAIGKDEVIAKIKVVPEMGSLNAAESRVNLAEIEFKQAEKEIERIEKLYRKGVISKEEHEKGGVSFQLAKEELQAAQDNLDIIRSGISQRSRSYSTTLIRSTVKGLILDIPVKEGTSVVQSNNFNEGTTVATVANMSDMVFKGKVDETDIGRIHTNMDISLSLGALESVQLKAKLELISPKGVEDNGAVLFEIKAAVKIPDSVFIRAGYSANAEIITDKRDSVFTIPEYCIEFEDNKTYVYFLKQEKPKQIFERKSVKLGLSDGIRIEVLDGVSVTDKLRGNEIDKKKKSTFN